MSSLTASPDPEPAGEPVERPARERCYWAAVLAGLGMQQAQAERLAADPNVDRHAVRDALERGCDPDLAFLIYS